jgi:3-dehydroquinate synthetase/shikimate kinase
MRGIDRPVFITGFMGTGKSTVGRELARLLGVPFLDTDRAVEMRSRMSVDQIFRVHGEARFRQMEAQVVREACGLRGCVVALGGGSLLDRRIRDQVASSGRLVCLEVPLEELRRRLAGSPRPPMAGASLEELMDRRRESYAGAELSLDGGDRSPADLAREVADRLGLQPIPTVPPERLRFDALGLEVVILGGAAEDLWGPVAELSELGEAFVVGDLLTGPMFASGVACRGVSLVPRGEGAKELSVAEGLYDAFCEAGLRRSSWVVMVGGGTVGDVGAFAGSTYLRGLRLVQCPTTLLSQVDSALGGKCGVNRPQGKNLVGTFAFPSLMVCHVGVLMSLSWDHFRQGLGEMAKYAMMDREFRGWLRVAAGDLRRRDPVALAMGVRRCVEIKARVVERDPFERLGVREVLNLGHTVGHGIEAASGFRVGHGDAVAAGLMVDVALSVRLGLSDPLEIEELKGLLGSLGLPVVPCGEWGELEGYVLRDKKAVDGGIRMALPGRCGPEVRVVSVEELRRAFMEVVRG